MMKNLFILFVLLFLSCSSLDNKSFSKEDTSPCNCSIYQGVTTQKTKSIFVNKEGGIQYYTKRKGRTSDLKPIDIKVLELNIYNTTNIDFDELSKYKNIQKVILSIHENNSSFLENFKLSQFEKLCEFELRISQKIVSNISLSSILENVDNIPVYTIYSNQLNKRINSVFPKSIDVLKVGFTMIKNNDQTVDLISQLKNTIIRKIIIRARWQDDKNKIPSSPAKHLRLNMKLSLQKLILDFSELQGVKELEFRSIYFGLVYPEISKFNKLKKISFVNCNINRFPQEFFNLPNLELFSIWYYYRNQAYYSTNIEFPKEVYNLPELKTLIFYPSNVTKFPVFPDSKKLETFIYKGKGYLNMRTDTITKVPHFLENHKKTIKNIWINNTDIKLLPNYFNELKLNSLNLDNNQIKSLDNIIDACSYTEHLSYDINPISHLNRLKTNNLIKNERKREINNQYNNYSIINSVLKDDSHIYKRMKLNYKGCWSNFYELIKEKNRKILTLDCGGNGYDLYRLIIDSVPSCYYDLRLDSVHIDHLMSRKPFPKELSFGTKYAHYQTNDYGKEHLYFPLSVEHVTYRGAWDGLQEITPELRRLDWVEIFPPYLLEFDEHYAEFQKFSSKMFSNRPKLDTVIIFRGNVDFSDELTQMDVKSLWIGYELDTRKFKSKDSFFRYQHELDGPNVFIKGFPKFHKNTPIINYYADGNMNEIEIPNSIQYLDKLKTISLVNKDRSKNSNYYLPNISSLENLFKSESIETIKLINFTIPNLPKTLTNAKNLKKLEIRNSIDSHLMTPSYYWNKNDTINHYNKIYLYQKEHGKSENLLQIIPDEIGQLENLEFLFLEGVFKEIPQSILNLKKLEVLILKGNFKCIPAFLPQRK